MTPSVSLALHRTIAPRDLEAVRHAARVAALSERVAAALGVDGRPLHALRVGAPLHDLGKLAVRAAVLQKPGPLDAGELVEIRRHPLVGARLVGRVEAFGDAISCVLHHHERWDGTGYPHRLAGHAIPLEARILAVADAYDAMTSDRPYREALGHDAAVAEVDRCSGTQFDPDVARAFRAVSAKLS